ncbi:hypothetical protein ACIPH4_37175 [Streptomyces tendae]|uniref:AMP-binding enzyme n=1 Tax=Streptomyces tendae TaxID=1932 RepID=UPI00381B3120
MVAEAAAFPVPSALAEDEVMVAVVPRPDRVLDPAQVARHCAGELPAFAVPRYVDVVAALPLTETGKVRKSVLRERGVTGGTWDRCRHDPVFLDQTLDRGHEGTPGGGPGRR